MLSLRPLYLLAALALSGTVGPEPYNTFDGPGFLACHDVAAVHDARSVDEIQSVPLPGRRRRRPEGPRLGQGTHVVRHHVLQ
ncbi:hypothetical protein CDEST_07869 [Colletotrichum destructivum]|uniref:Uncharacterized protein n=1 Tax=Colletotrichum destructivum TaxID=34406 RepID=A0AAX4IHB8_9PEZI|nr:hypothetical protein CDEST_07869 [Colletotrichum destructivum]